MSDAGDNPGAAAEEQAPPPAAATAEAAEAPAEADAPAAGEAKPAKKRSRKEPAAAAAPAAPDSGRSPRDRKQREFFQVAVKEKAEFVIKPGKGTKLGEIPNVHFHISKLKTDDELLGGLHAVVFKRPGTSTKRKRNLYEFSGFAYEEDEQEKEVEKAQDKLNKWTLALLNSALDLFEIPRGSGEEGRKESKVERLIKFLEAPKQMSDKDLAAAAVAKKEKAAAKKERAAAKKAKKAGGDKPKGRKKKDEEEDDDDEEEEEDEQEEEEEEKQEEPPKKKGKKAAKEVEEEEEEEEAPKPKKAAKAKPAKKEVASPKKKEKAAPKAKKAEPAKKRGGKKKEEVEEDEEEEEQPKKRAKTDGPIVEEPPEAEEDEDDDAPLGAVASGIKLPSDSELRDAVLKTLADVDVNAMTMKQLMAQLSTLFKQDMTAKKGFIKEVAVEFAKTQQPEENTEDAAAAQA